MITQSLRDVSVIFTDWLAQLVEHRTTIRAGVGLNPGWTNTQGLLITEEKVLPL